MFILKVKTGDQPHTVLTLEKLEYFVCPTAKTFTLAGRYQSRVFLGSTS